MIKTDFYNTHGELIKLKPHQKIIVIDSTQTYQGHGTLKIHNGIWEKVYKDTKGSAAFGLYCYLASNVDKYTSGFSPQAVRNCLGMDVKTARNALNNLIQLGYITNDSKFNNVLIFHISPVKSENQPVVLDDIDAQMAIMSSDKHVKRAMQYAHTEEDLEAIDTMIESRMSKFMDNRQKPQETDQPEKAETTPLPYMTKMSTVLAEDPDLLIRYHSAHTKEEMQAVCDEIRKAVIQKYGTT